MSYKNKFQSNNTDLQTILDIVNTLPDAGSTGANIETCTVTIDDGNNTYYVHIDATIFENDEINSVSYGDVYGESLSEVINEDNYAVLNNIVKNSVVTIVMGDIYTAGTITGATLLYQESCDYRHSFFTFKILDDNAEIMLNYGGDS